MLRSGLFRLLNLRLFFRSTQRRRKVFAGKLPTETVFYICTSTTVVLILPTENLYNEKELLLQVAEGNEAAFRAIYDRYKKSFYLTAFKLTRSSDISEDIVQEVFTALWKKRSYLAQAPNPVGYLMTMLHNSVFYHFRRLDWEKEMKKQIASDLDAQENNPVEELLLAKEHQHLLKAIIGQLSPQQQMVYYLSRQEGLSRNEIAERMNISPNTVRNHLHIALTTIKAHFKKVVSSMIWAIIWNHL